MLAVYRSTDSPHRPARRSLTRRGGLGGRERVRGRAARAGALVFALLLSAAATARAEAPYADKLRHLLNRPPHPGVRTAACVMDPRTGAVEFACRADDPMAPASVQKVFTMAAALETLGAGFTFQTVCAVEKDHLVVIGDGDPGLGDDRLCAARGERITTEFTRWAAALKQRGITELAGGIVIDDSVFDRQWRHPSWEAEDLGQWYAAPVGGVNFNDNCVEITVWPGERPGGPAHWSINPPNDAVRIVNECVTGAAGQPTLYHLFDSPEYRITGTCSKRWPFSSLSFPDPGLLTAASVRAVLASDGIRVAPTLSAAVLRRPGRHPAASLDVVAVHKTSLADAFVRIGKHSQNFFAECAIKRTGYEWSGRHNGVPAGSWRTGERAVVDTLQRAGIDVRGLIVADGSGLSRDNRCTARQLTGTLVWAKRREDGGILLDALAVAGVDGSLEENMPELKGRVRAKTGTMRGVRTLAGFVTTDSGRDLAFAVLFNDYPGTSAPYKKLQYDFCRILATEG